MEIETNRLILHALNENELELWAEDMPALETALGVTYHAEPMTGIFYDIVCEQLAATKKDPSHYVWHSFWLMIRKSDRVVLGSADFKDVPDMNGETEIGYGLGLGFCGNGYMTETVEALCRFAAQNGAKTIIAETECDGFASQSVLKRCGFTKYKRAETDFFRLSLTGCL